MPNSRETIQINNEDHIRREIEMQEELKRLNATLGELLKHSEERDKKVDEMYEVFNNGRFLTSVIKWGFGLLLALGGAYLMVKSILNAQN